MDNRPIGVFDSGVGGLTVMKALIRALPHENIIYLGDTARVPYGNKSRTTVTRFSEECTRFLKKFNIKLAVVACNTASSWSLGILKRKFRFPIIGVITPGVKEACSKTRNLKIGVVGTKATVNSGSYVKGIKRKNRKIKVFQIACPLFVPLVEENRCSGDVTFNVAKEYLQHLKSKKVDTLILGCTHYPLLKSVLARVLGRDVNIVDSSVSVSNEVKTFLGKNKLKAGSRGKGYLKFYVTDDPRSFGKISKIFLRKNIKVNKVDLL